MKIKFTISNGKITNGRQYVKEMFESLKDGDYILPAPFSLEEPHTVVEWRKLYFYLRDLIHEEADTGYTRNELHSEIKKVVLAKMWEMHKYYEKNVWFTGDDPTSTKSLSTHGWKEYVRRFKEFAMETFNIYV